MKNIFKIAVLWFSVLSITLFFVVLILKFTNNLSPFWNIFWIFSLSLTFSMIFIILKIKEIPSDQVRNHEIVLFVKYLFFLMLFILFINQFFQKSIIVSYIHYLVCAAVFFGIAVFYSYRNSSDLEDDRSQDKLSENRRSEYFSLNFPKLSKLKYGGVVFRWGYKEGPCLWGLVCVLFISGFFYFNGIGSYGFQGDEYYHASVAKNFLENSIQYTTRTFGEYTRSPITTLTFVFSSKLFTFLSLNYNDEFIFRFPIVISSLISLVLVYFILKRVTKKIDALLITSIFSLDILVIYFSKFLRFYSYTLLIIVLSIFLFIKFKNRALIPIFIITLLAFFFLSEYAFIVFVFVIIYAIYSNRTLSKTKRISLISIIIILCITIFIVQVGPDYIKPNSKFIHYQVKWLFINYSSYFVLFIVGGLTLFFNDQKVTNKIKIIFLFGIFNTLFFLLYVNQVNGFNFTFRPFYFIIPFIIIVGFVTLRKIMNKPQYYLILICLIIINLIISINYNINEPGDRYYPTKLVNENEEIIGGTKDLAEFIKTNISTTGKEYSLYLIGVSSLYYYTENENITIDYFFSSTSTALSNDFDYFINTLNTSSRNDAYFVCYFNSRYRPIYSQRLFFNIEGKSSANPRLCDYIELHGDLIYISNDKMSRIYVIKH